MQSNREMIPIVLVTTFGAEQWDVSLPIDVPVQALIQKLAQEPQLPFREQVDAGGTVPWRLMWKQRGRYLQETETLRTAGVQPKDTLIMAIEPRAGTTTTPDTP